MNVRFHILESSTGKNIETISTMPAEEEVLFRPGSRFKVTKVGPDSYLDDSVFRFVPTHGTAIHLEEVP